MRRTGGGAPGRAADDGVGGGGGRGGGGGGGGGGDGGSSGGGGGGSYSSASTGPGAPGALVLRDSGIGGDWDEEEETTAAPPMLSCRSWLVANGSTGEVLMSSGADTSVQIASLTKVMTAFIVLAAAEAERELLEELVLISPEASAVGGTTASVRTGEVYTVRDLLYGMMLPSGNDAAVALAEYLGDAYKPASRTKHAADVHPVDKFVAEMNRVAKRLGLRNTTFGNPHGLQHFRLNSCAADVCTLAHKAMEFPLFRKIVGARAHAATVRVVRDRVRASVRAAPRKYPYKLSWANTNVLLGAAAQAVHSVEGKGGLPFVRPGALYEYDGIKTGITTAAGGCLATQIARVGGPALAADLPRLIIVVLGSAGAEARFSDTERLAGYALSKLRL